ncbi:MAG: glycosyltransferase [Nitrospirae bacterium]|nr:glycosyltransferase [Nitrospirota bacterium]
MTGRKIKILRLITRLNNGGPAKHVIWLASGLNKDRFESLLASGVVEDKEDALVDYAKSYNITPFLIPELSRSISPFKDLAALTKIIKLLFRFKPDIIHTHTSKAGFLGRTAGLIYRLFNNAYIIHTFHGHTFHSYFHPLKEKLFLSIERFLARYATDKIIVISKQQLEEIHERFGIGRREQFEIIPLGIDFNKVVNTDNENKFRKEFKLGDCIVVGIIGRVAPVKNHKMFIDVASEVIKKGFKDKVMFIIIGGGSEKDIAELKDYARQKEAVDRIIFAGNRYDASNFYGGIDILAITSLNEGTPLSLIEGMAVKGMNNIRIIEQPVYQSCCSA